MYRRKDLTGLKIALLLVIFIFRIDCLVPTAPIIATPNTESSPSNFIFNFQLSNSLLSSSYLMVVFPIYPSTITPYSCILLTSTNPVTACINLNTASGMSPNPLTINATAVNNINPNIQSLATIVIGFSLPLAANTQYSLQITIQSTLPSIGALSSNFEMYAISGSGVMEEENWNMGQVFFQLKNNNLMDVVSINSQVSNLPGTTVSTFLIDIKINVACPTSLSRFKFTISGDFQFTVSSLVNSIGVTGTPPQISSMTVVSQNIIEVVFNQQFSVGRQFRLTISNIYNPLQISSGSISVYSMPYNSISPLQVFELSIPFQTISYTPTVTILTAQGLSPSAPMEFYSSNFQYITITILLPRNFNPNFILQISSDVLVIQQGSVFARTSTINSNTLIYQLTNSSTVQISGFPSIIPSGSLITVTMRVYISINPIFNIYVSIDQLTSINTPIIYGTSSATVSAQPTAFISAINGSQSQNNKLTAMQTTTSSIFFSVTPLFQTFAGSFLQIYTSSNLIADSTFLPASSCLINSTAQPCTIVTNSQYTVITIASTSSSNLFPQSMTTIVTINQLKFLYASSHSFYNYHLYYMLTVSQASQAVTKKFLSAPMVVQQRNQLTNFKNYFSNTIYNSGNNFLSVVRLVSTDPTQWQNIIQSNQKRIISIFAYQGWTNLFTTLQSGNSYVCGKNIAATCTYVKGSTYSPTLEYPLNWDRINIVLSGSESTSKFSIILPTLIASSVSLSFQIMIGIIDTNNGAITYLNSGPRPTAGASTYLVPANIAVYSKPKQSAMQLSIAGLAASYMSNISFVVAPSSSFSATTYSSALIVISSWQFLDSKTSLSTTSLSSANPTFNNVQQTPLCVQISSTSYLTYIPFKTTAVYGTNFNIVFNNIKLPYNLDLPYYSVMLIDENGAVDGYNQFINQNQGVFYTGYLSNLSITCNDNSMGVISTYCTIKFVPFQDIQVKSILTITFTGMYVSTSLCSLVYSSTTVSITSCTPNTNLNVLTISLGNNARLPGLNNYTLTINGISIDKTAKSNYISFTIMDPSGSYAIQTRTKILVTSVTQNFPIYINQLNFDKNNPVVISSLFINFTLPRSLNADQSFALVMSKDFTNLNNIPCKINIRLLQADGITQIPTQWILKYINSQIIFQDLQGSLTSSTYSLEMYGIKVPSTITQDMISIIYLRIYDNTYTKQNTVASTATFPTLSSKINSLITLSTYFNTEGLEQELQFTVVNQYITVNQYSVWIVNLPRYYSPKVWNNDNLIYCTISGTPLPCTRSTYTPYQIIISNSPLIIQIGVTYSISIYGIPCPRATYLNGNSLFITQNIFFAMSASANATSYSEYSELFVSNTIINPQNAVGYGSIKLTSVTSSNMQVYQSTFFTIILRSTVALGPGNWIYITFPPQFNNFNGISVIVQTQYSVTNFEVSTGSTVVNTRIGYNLSSLSIPANTDFQIMITSLMTPRNPGTIDMNQMSVFFASSNRLTTIATTTQTRNQLGSLTFIPNTLHLKINNYNQIMITAGTYSTPIKISPSDNTAFLTNMLISFSSNQLTFVSNPTYMYLGNYYSNFIIGVDTNLVPTMYTFNLVKKETSISSLYSTLSQYSVTVTSVPVLVSFPSSFTVPIGGCSLPIEISVPNPPFTQLNINFQYNTTLVPPNMFWVNQEISYDTLSFNLNSTSSWLSFCSNYTINVSTFPITLQLGGDNSASYSLSTSTTTMNIVNNAAANITPTYTLSIANIQKTYINVKVATNLAGFFYYQIQLAPLITPYSLIKLKSSVKANTLILQSNDDFLTTQIYSKDRDQRVGFSPAYIAGNNYVNIIDLLPKRDYAICGYFSNQFGASTSVQCVNFTMQSWGLVSKATISFTQSILANQLNNVLCFFVKASNSQINQIIDLEGNSCSLNTSPINYNYKYKGNTTTKELTQTIIYHITSPNLTTDASVSGFNNLFNATSIKASSLSYAQTQFSINYISTSTPLPQFDPLDAINLAANSFKPTVTLIFQPYTPKSYVIQVTNIQTDLPSSIYFVLVSYKNISTNQITGKTIISIKPKVIPTTDQIASCLDGTNAPAVQCSRIVMLSGQNYSLSLTSLTQNSVYVLYYAIANQYPLRPVFYGIVNSQTLFTVSWQKWDLLSILLGLGMLLMF